jgi:hypothetical protein
VIVRHGGNLPIEHLCGVLECRPYGTCSISCQLSRHLRAGLMNAAPSGLFSAPQLAPLRLSDVYAAAAPHGLGCVIFR